MNDRESPEERGPRLAREYLRAYKLQIAWYRDSRESLEWSLVAEKVLARRVDRAAGLLEHWLKRIGEPLILRSRDRFYKFTIDWDTGHIRLHHARLGLSKTRIDGGECSV